MWVIQIEEEHARKLRALVSSSHGQLKEVSPLAVRANGESKPRHVIVLRIDVITAHILWRRTKRRGIV